MNVLNIFLHDQFTISFFILILIKLKHTGPFYYFILLTMWDDHNTIYNNVHYLRLKTSINNNIMR